MKKYSSKILSSTALVVILSVMQTPANAAYVTPHQPYTKPHTPYMQQNTVSTVRNYTPTRGSLGYSGVVIRMPAIISSGTNYISRDIATGEVKQVVQVAPPPAYGGQYY